MHKKPLIRCIINRCDFETLKENYYLEFETVKT